MPIITLYSKPNCPLCDHTRHYLRAILAAMPTVGDWTLEEISILDDQDLYAAFRYLIPVVVVDGGAPLGAPESLDVNRLRAAVAAVGAHPGAPAESPAPAYPSPYYGSPGRLARAVNAVGNGLGAHWLALANTVVGVFSTLPWLAPIFARLGWWGLADSIYTMYMLFCHQLPERAGNLFGYQVAYCYRNTAIYSTVFLTGLLFALARRGGRRGALAWILEPLRWQMFVLATIPIAVDGLTHLFGLREDNAWFDALTGGRFGDFAVGDTAGTLNWWLRIITGMIFGFAVTRLIFPWVQIAFDESRRLVWPVAAPPASLEPAQPAASA